MEHQLRFSKVDNTPWGFRLTGGCDCSMPLTVLKVSEGGLAQRTGMREHDVITRINNLDTTQLSHDEAHEAILCAGNDFTATVLRYIGDFTEQPTIGIEPETFSLSEPSSLTNDINQVPDYGTTVPVYKPFSNKAFEELTPLENPLILSPKYDASFQTIKQQEWKEFSAKMSKKTSNETSIQENGLNGHIDVTEIEQSAKEVSVSQSSEQVSKVCTKKQETIREINKIPEEAKIMYVSEVKVTHISNIEDEKREVQESSEKTEKNESVKTAVNSEFVNQTKEIKTSNEMYDKSKEISLEDAKVKAIRAASKLSHQAKVKGQTFEATKMGTIEAYETISQNIKHKCSEVPCNLVKCHTHSHTDLLLKTFFIHLTDVMVALTQMISQDGSVKCCKTCSSHCVCSSKKENVTSIAESAVNNIMNVMKTQSEETTEEKNTTEVLKEVIDNIQSATGVDVTVNGKDPLEWLADLDQGKTAVVCESASSAENIESAQSTEVVQITECAESSENSESAKSIEIFEIKESAESSENIESSEATTVAVEAKKECVTEAKMEESSSTVVSQQIRQKKLVGQEKEVIVYKEEPQQEEVKEAKVPQTPNTEEYVFKLDIKIKGLRDSPIKETPVEEKEEPTIHEDLSIVRRKKPTFSIGDVTIERTVNKFDDEVIESTAVIEEKLEMASKNVLKGEVSSVLIACDGMQTKEKFSLPKTEEIPVELVQKSAGAALECVTNNTNTSLTNDNMSLVDDVTISTNKASSSEIDTELKTSDTNSELNTSSTVVGSISASGINTINDTNITTTTTTTTLASAYNNVSSSSFKKDEEAVHETVLTSIKEMNEMSEETKMSIEESVTFVEEAQVKTMGELNKSFATVNSSQIRNVGDVDEEDIGKPGLSDEEITEIISNDTAEKEQHIIGLTKVLASHMNRPDDEINNCEIKDLVPQMMFLRDSEVFKALNEENLRIKAERLHEARRKYTTFLQRPNRPIPFCKKEAERLSFKDPPYRVNIKKQDRKNSMEEEQTTSILSEGLFLVPEVPILVPEPLPQYLEAPEYLPDNSFPDLEDTGIKIPEKVVEQVCENNTEEIIENHIQEETVQECVKEESGEKKLEVLKEEEEEEEVEEEETSDENLSMEQQLERVQKQLIALSTLPATIQQTLDLVTKKITKIVTKSSTEQTEVVSNQETVKEEKFEAVSETQEEKEEEEEEVCERVEEKDETVEEEGKVEEVTNEGESEQKEESERMTNGVDGSKPEEVREEVSETRTMMAKEEVQTENTKSKVEGKDIHTLRKDVINELNEEHVMRQVKQRPGGRVGRPKPAFGPLTPQERPIVLPGGRRWRGPKDAFTDSFIAETLSGQAEVIMGKALGNHVEYIYPPFDERVNFMKYAKPPPSLDHLKNSSVYKLIHDEEEPLKGVLARPDIVLAESDYREKCRSVTPTSFDKTGTEVN